MSEYFFYHWSQDSKKRVALPPSSIQQGHDEREGSLSQLSPLHQSQMSLIMIKPCHTSIQTINQTRIVMVLVHGMNQTIYQETDYKSLIFKLRSNWFVTDRFKLPFQIKIDEIKINQQDIYFLSEDLIFSFLIIETK